MIKITFLGTMCEEGFPRQDCDCPQCREARKLGERYHHRLHSSLLVEADGKKLMIDAGEGHEGTVARVKPDAILITHAHPDHLSRALESLEPEIPVYISEETAEVVKLPNKRLFQKDEAFEVEGFKVVARPVVHSLVAPAVCFKISRGGFILVYAPDVLSIPGREQFLKGVDLYIGDGSSLTKDIIRRRDDKLFGHASMMRQVRWAEGIKQILFAHVGHLRKTEADVNQALRIASDGRAKLAEDGMSLEFEILQVATETIAPVLAPVVPVQAEPQNLIEKAEDYDASAPRDDQLRDDWRIVCGWYSTLKEGGNIKFSEETIIQVASKILKELLRRKRRNPSVFTAHPGEMKEHARELYERITKGWKPEDKAFLETKPRNLEVTTKHGMEELELREIASLWVSGLFGSYGGKTKISRRIAALMPPHETYVEPFAGGAAVFFHKEKAPVEVLNDKDSEIAFAYRFARRITDGDIARLRKRQWIVNRATFDRLKRETPKDELDRFYRFLYLAYARFRKQGLRINTGTIGRRIAVVDRLPRLRERLQNVRIYNADFEPVIKKFDGPKTLFYLDPPYPSRIQDGLKFDEQDLERLIEVLSGIKGKFILSLDHEQRKKLPQKWEVKVIRRPRETTRWGDLLVVPDTELLVFNFDPSKENLEALEERPLEDYDTEELILWHNRLHEFYANEERRKAANMSLEDVVNEHALVVDEMARRHLRHFIVDELDEKSLPFQTSKFEQYHWPVAGTEGEVTLTEVLESLPQELIINQPVYLSGRPVNEGRVDPASGSDIDVIFPPLGEELADCLPPEISELLHTFYDADAPAIGFALPIYRIILKRLPLPIPDGEPDETLPRPEAMKRSLVPAFVKPAPGFEEFEFGDPETLWENWAREHAIPQGKKVVVEPKWDGFVMAFVKDGDDVEIVTEDEKRDRAKYLPQLVEEVKSLPCDQVVFFGEVIWFQDGKATEREQAIRLVISKEVMADLDLKVFTYEIVRSDGEDLSKLGYLERMRHLDKLLPRDKKHFKKTPRYVVDTKAEFLNAVEKVKDLEGSEGAMAKLEDWVFAEATVDKEGIGRTRGMAKFKKTYDVEVEVAKVIPKRESETHKPIPGQWMYDCVVRDEQSNAIPIGTTYTTSLKANVGDIITVRTQRLRAYTDDKGRILKLSWMWPKVLGLREKRKEPTPWKELLKIVSIIGRAEQLEPCPFVEDPDVCPLYSRFEHSEPLGHLRFPIKCVLASAYRCLLVKPYYHESPREVTAKQ